MQPFSVSIWFYTHSFSVELSLIGAMKAPENSNDRMMEGTERFSVMTERGEAIIYMTSSIIFYFLLQTPVWSFSTRSHSERTWFCGMKFYAIRVSMKHRGNCDSERIC